MGSLVRDVRFACRLLAARPGWTLAAILCLAIATGANTAAFSVVNALILRPLPFEESDRLVMVALQEPDSPNTRPFSLTEYRDVAARTEGSSELLARTFLPVGLAGTHGAQMVEAEFVSGNYFDTLRVAPAAGRFFDAGMDRPGAAPVAVISHALWQRGFGGDASIVGQVVRVNARPLAIVGIAPRGFVGATRLVAADLWLPAAFYADMAGAPDGERTPMFGVLGRIPAGATREHVRARLNASVAAIGRDHGIARRTVTVVDPAVGFGVPPVARRLVAAGSVLLFGLMGLLITVAAANVAALVLARASGRLPEIGVRLALGASRWQIAKQMLTESLVLAAAGGAAGWLLAVWVTRIVASRMVTPFEYVSYAVDIQPDLRVLGYSIAAMLAIAGLVGLAPVRHAARVDLIDVVKRSSSSGRGRTMSGTLGWLVVAQMAASTALLVASGLLIRSYLRAQDVAPGFDTRNLVAASLDMNQIGVGPNEGRRVAGELTTRLSALPLVSGTCLTRTTPLAFGSAQVKMWTGGGTEEAGSHVAGSEVVGPDCFRLLGMPLVLGRSFREVEPAQPLVAVVNETMARRVWPNASPLGQRFRTGESSGAAIEVIGVVSDAADRSSREPVRSVFYQPFSQVYSSRITLLVGTPDDSGRLDRIRQEIQTVNGDLAVQSLRTLDDHLDAAVMPRRNAAVAMALVSVLGLLLGSLGLYGVVSYGVAERARELAIRLALGARAAQVRWMILRLGLGLTALGLIAGIALSFAMTRALRGTMFGVGASDPVTIGIVSIVLALATCVALYLPAHRVTTLDPAATLRSE